MMHGRHLRRRGRRDMRMLERIAGGGGNRAIIWT